MKDPLRLTPITCRWLPCGNILAPDARGDFCGASHRVRATQEAARLKGLLAQLDQPGQLRDDVLAGVPRRERDGHLKRIKSKVRHRLVMLRPDGPSGAGDHPVS